MNDINFNAITQKAKIFMKSPDGKRKKDDAVEKKTKNGTSSPDMAALDFINVLLTEINEAASSSSDLSDGALGASAVEALSHISHTKPLKINNNQYTVDIFFDGDMSRPSLVPHEHRSHDYDDIKNIAALLNNGYGDENTVQVRGIWHGKSIKSLPHRIGANFIGNAVNRFINDYQKKYIIIDVRPDDIYK